MALVLEDESLGWLTSGKASEGIDVAALVQVHGALLYRVALSIVRSPAEAEDIVQETFLRAVEQKGKLAEVAVPKAWLVRVAWNLALDKKRRVTPQQLEGGVAAMACSADLPVDRRLAAAAELGRVLAAMDKMPKAERAVLLLSAVEELSMAEIAEVVGRSESGVRALLFRARTHLEERLRAQRSRELRMGRSGGRNERA